MKIIAHRGSSAAFPENTRTAFGDAWRAGADGIELDVRLSRDGRVVVFHDADGLRLAGVPGAVSDHDWSEIATWRVAGEPIPLLDEVLISTPEHGLVLVEIKVGLEILAPLGEMLLRFRQSNTAILCFDPEVAVAARNLGRPVWLNVEASYLSRLDEVIRLALKHSLNGISIGWSSAITRRHVELIESAGLSMAVWTVNDVEDAKRLRDVGVHILMTDDPRRMLKELADVT